MEHNHNQHEEHGGHQDQATSHPSRFSEPGGLPGDGGPSTVAAGGDGGPTHERHAGHDVNVLWKKFWVTLVLTAPVLVYSPMVQHILRFTPPAFPLSSYIPAIFGTIIFLYGGLFFLKGAVGEIADRRPGMMVLISLAITVAFLYSTAVTLGYPGEALYWELSTLIVIMLLGHWIEMKAIGSARGALRELAKLMPDEAELLIEGKVQTVNTADLMQGDLLLIRPGAKIPADAEVVEGDSSVNESMITGESKPVSKSVGDKVIAGTVNGDGSLRAKVTKVGEETALAGIMRLVSEAQESKSMAQNLADRAALWLTLIAIAAGIITFIAWSLTPLPKAFALERTVTVLVVACPHALGLAIPLVLAISTTLAAKGGLLVRDRMALETARNIDVVVFDKTGTLTKGEMGVVGIYTIKGVDENAALVAMAAVERDSEHSLARAIVKSAQDKGLDIPDAREFRALPGMGVEATLEGRRVAVGGPRLLESLNVDPPEELEPSLSQARDRGQSIVYLLDAGKATAAVALADVIRPESREAVDRLREMGVEVAMLTGDSEDVAKSVASELGITEYYAGVLPADKEARIRGIKKSGRRVAMVGDGVNDAPALVSADVGIAIGAGTDVAVEAGGIVLVRNDPRDIPRTILLSRASYAKMVQNLLWATAYNAVATPLAAGILMRYGVVMAPAVGAVLMSGSTVIVALNAQLLRRVKL